MKQVTALTRDPGMLFINEMPTINQFKVMLGQVEDLAMIHKHYKDEDRTLIAIAGEKQEDGLWLYTTRSFLNKTDDNGKGYFDLVDEYVDVRTFKVNVRVRMYVASTQGADE